MATFTYLHELYDKQIDRPFNPAVNASDFKETTVGIEISEYVFTDEIINNMFRVLSAIRDRQTSHNGIWINGYFGSGKSHFLKFLDYCLHPLYREEALKKLTEAVKEHDPLQNPDSRCDVTVSDITLLSNWLKSADIETDLFNIGSVANSNTTDQKVFTEVFWNELNRHRGYNTFNLSLAQYLEKELDDNGKFEEFKSKLFDEYRLDWSKKASRIANTQLDTVLEVAKEVLPSLSTDAIRQRIIKNDFPISVEAFMNELRSFVANKPDNFRFIFFADEISQFIDKRGSLLLQLQQIVSDLHEACDGKVWIACTAQQDLSEILGDCHISKTTDEYGKIMGRFEVKVSLKGTNSEYITQKRILEKKGSAAIELEKQFDQIHSKIAAQLLLPTGYNTYRNKAEYAAYYPFVPYQFTLMMNIFDAFVSQTFVDKEVKGNERSIIKITYSVANDTKDQKVGNLISFDQFYNAMFRGSLTSKGQKAIAMANSVIESYNVNRELAQRVVNILFMICNMDEQQRRVFPATTDHVTSLLMRDVDENKLRLKGEVQAVIDYLCDNNILRRDTLADGHTEFYSFFTEEERRVAASISNQYVDNDFMASVLVDFFKEYLAPQNRESFCSSKFSIGGIVNGKTFLTSNADIQVDFVFEYDGNAHDYAFRNVSNRLGFFLAEGFSAEPQLRNRLTWICKVRKFLQSPEGQSTSDARKAALDKFRQMANDEYKEISKSLKALFNTAPVISYNQPIAIASSTKDKARYDEALQRHLQNVYTYAKVVVGDSVPRNESELKGKILRPSDKNEYTGANQNLSPAEELINTYIKNHGAEANLKDIVREFAGVPYGWSQEATIFFTNELVRRNIREYTYNNAENPSRNIVASNIVKDSSRFMVKAAKEISQDVINEFIGAWHEIFGDVSTPSTSHPADIHNWAREILNVKIGVDQEAIGKLGTDSPVSKRLKDSIELLRQWLAIRDDEQFFRRIVSDKEDAKLLMDQTKQIREFVNNSNFFSGYKEFLAFVSDNRDNWEYLPQECKADIEGIKAIVTEPWPIDKMRHYKRIKQTLGNALEDVRKSLRDKIKEKLYAQNEELALYAAENAVEYVSKVDGAIACATISSNIPTLRNNEISNDWYTSQIEEINRKIQGAASTKVKKVRLKTSSLSNVKDMEGIEKYLDGIRIQLINHLASLSNGDEMQIL